MSNNAGMRLPNDHGEGEVIVTRGGDGELGWSPEGVAPVALGKRYECPSCGTQALAIKASPSTLVCCGEAVTQLEPKKTKSAD